MSSLGIEKTKEVAAYMRQLYNAELQGKDDVPLPHWSIDLAEDCRYAVKVILKAVKNERRTLWSVNDYTAHLRYIGPRCSGQQDKIEAALTALFPACEKELIFSPCVVGDIDGRALAWYLPGLISPKRQALTWHSLETIETLLKVKTGDPNWRINEQHYRPASECRYKPGTLSFALAWFQQGMAGKREMEVAAVLRNPLAREWVQQTEETCSFLGGILSIINPAQYNAGIAYIEAIGRTPERVAKRDHLEHLLNGWTSPYAACSLMNNRDSPLHRDNGGGYSSMDLLTSVGEYTDGRFFLPGLGVELWYASGTVVGIAGRVLRHGAKSNGERLCIAQYSRENVLEALDICEPEWTVIGDLLHVTDS